MIVLKIQRENTTQSLLESSLWNRLAGGNPLRQSTWLLAWWEAFADTLGSDAEPYVITARQADGALLAALPLVRYRERGRRRLIAFGQGEACTDHVSILTLAKYDTQVAGITIGRWLASVADSSEDGWDQLDIDGMVEGDPAVIGLATGLEQRQAVVRATSRMSVWCKPTRGETWQEHLCSISKSSRRKMKARCHRVANDVALAWQTTESVEDVTRQINQLIEIHQRKWESAGQPGSFANDSMRRFITSVVVQFFQQQRLRLPLLMHEGELIAGELQVVGDDGVLYSYMSGMEPRFEALEPGRIITATTLRHVYETGMMGLDMLRGDETYKQRIRGEPRRLLQLQAEAPSMTPQLKKAAWSAAFEVKQWVRGQLGRSPVVSVDLHQ